MVAPTALVCALLVIAGVFVVINRSFGTSPAVADPTTTTAPTTTTTTAPLPQVPASTDLATPVGGEIPTFDAPDGNQVGTIGVWYGYPITTPIVEDRGAWLLVRRPERPNESTAWVRRQDITTSSTPYRIVIRLSQTNVTVYQGGYPLFTIPAGVGAERTPTPTGSFFVAVIERPGPPGYGPIVLDTSGHSNVIQSWEGSGDAVTAIHGPISGYSDEQIGTTGTYISNGCVRLHVDDQLKLDPIPLGTPVDIVA
jgi:lipoprotein-anchoring transpeptidase ErfK/SrfK